MGQINSAQDASATHNVPVSDSVSSERDNENAKVSEKVRCVKTRIDMLIEDCLNSKDSTHSEKSESNDVTEKKNQDTFNNEENKTVDTSEESQSKSVEGDLKDEHNKIVATVNCCSEDDLCSVKDSDSKRTVSKLDLSDIIKDSVNTELTQTQLRQIRQRTITTFNTFIDKVLDNSLNQEITKEDAKSKSNILKLCSESLNPAVETTEKKVTSKNKPELAGNNSNSENTTTEKTLTLKEHIERFLEISFRDECYEDDHKMPETKVTLPENFNAQGLVNSMITQGLKINKLLTKEKPNSPLQKTNSHMEEDKHSGRILRVNEHTQPAMSNQGQKSPSIRPYSDYNDRRNNHEVASHHMTDSRMRDHYLNATKVDPGQRMSVHSGYRMDEMIDRNRDIQAKMAFDGMGMGSATRPPSHVTSFHHSQHLQMGNNAYLHPAYGPRMQLSPGRREMKSPLSRDGKLHPRDCGCPYCMQMSQSCQNHDIPIPDHHSGKHSPVVSHALFDHGMAVQTAMAGHLREVPVAMMKPVGEMSPAIPGYHNMHKLMPHNQLISTSKVYSSAPHLVTGDIPPQVMMSGRRPVLHETGSCYFPQRPGDDMSPAERVAIRSGKRSPYQVRPSSVPSQEHSSRPGSGYRSTDSEFLRSSDSLSGASDCSNEAPLDLTVKKPKGESMRNRSASNGSNGRKINPSVTFIKHLESSVDKHWQELSTSPPPSPVQPQMTLNRPVTHNNGRNHSHPYPRQSPNGSPPAGMMTMLSNRSLRSPHFVGGITVGQPLVDIKPQVTQKQNENLYNNAHQTVPPMTCSQAQSQQHFQGNQSNVDMNSKRNPSNNVSKHEPIQNIIGNNDPNDILYLICRLCTQTYGSPYGFRKHFRNQHGFEPRAEHTIVQTISATKTALHLPQPHIVQGVANFHESHRARKSMSPEDGNESSKLSVSGSTGRRDSPASPADSRSITGSEDGEKCDIENSETKFLECPECGKTFQLNDFGSYKRHCRQHGSLKMNGPFTCSDCHLPFPDQKLLREHYILHVKEGPLGTKQEKAGTEALNQKNEKPSMKCYACVKCDVQFDNIDLYTSHINRHSSESQGSSSERSNSMKSEQKLTLSVKSERDSFSNIITSTNITIQAAESMTALVCPDSSWDNVAKATATSDKMESTSAELSESGHSNMSNCSEQLSAVKNENKSGSNCPSVNCSRQKSMESGSDTSEDKSGGTDEFMYKHKKFFHHRKRANSNMSVEATEPKQTKLSSESTNSTSEDLNGSSTGVTNTCTSTCETMGATSSKPLESQCGKSLAATNDKPTKTEARHSSLPFVWDRSVRSHRK